MDHTNNEPRVLRRMLHGFTLVEVMVVVAIIGILTAVLVPAMNGYITKSRLNSANGDAKVLFNSLQTICQEYEFADRSSSYSAFYGSNSTGKLVLSYNFEEAEDAATGINMIEVTPYGSNFDDFRSENSSVGSDANYLKAALNISSTKEGVYDYFDNPNLGNPDAANTVATTSTLRARLDRLYEENHFECWIAVIEDYQVRAAFCATSMTTNYVGAYPLKTLEKNGIADLLNTDEELNLSELVGSTSSMQDYMNLAWGRTITLS